MCGEDRDAVWQGAAGGLPAPWLVAEAGQADGPGFVPTEMDERRCVLMPSDAGLPPQGIARLYS
jgi:hypothetical protein